MDTELVSSDLIRSRQHRRTVNMYNDRVQVLSSTLSTIVITPVTALTLPTK